MIYDGEEDEGSDGDILVDERKGLGGRSRHDEVCRGGSERNQRVDLVLATKPTSLQRLDDVVMVM